MSSQRLFAVLFATCRKGLFVVLFCVWLCKIKKGKARRGKRRRKREKGHTFFFLLNFTPFAAVLLFLHTAPLSFILSIPCPPPRLHHPSAAGAFQRSTNMGNKSSRELKPLPTAQPQQQHQQRQQRAKAYASGATVSPTTSESTMCVIGARCLLPAACFPFGCFFASVNVFVCCLLDRYVLFAFILVRFHPFPATVQGHKGATCTSQHRHHQHHHSLSHNNNSNNSNSSSRKAYTFSGMPVAPLDLHSPRPGGLVVMLCL